MRADNKRGDALMISTPTIKNHSAQTADQLNKVDISEK
jgi:hypothetical protein